MLIGNLTRDPEIRYTPSGSPVTQIRLAVNRRYRDRDNNWRDDTVFLDVEVWGRQAETLSSQLHKGSSVFVDGRLKMDEWTSKDGTKRSKLVVTALAVMALASISAPRNADEAPRSAPRGEAPRADETNIAPDDDEPPF